MDKQTIDGVPRDDLELFMVYGTLTDESRAAGDRLRALLDKEVSGDSRAPQPQGEPVAWVHPDYLKPGALGFEASVCRLSTSQVPLYAEHPAPVAQKYDETLLPFVALMRKELHANDGKGDRPGWLSMTTDTCLLEIIYHFGKLQASVKRGDEDGIREYAADVANMCMMLVDICGLFGLTEQPAPVAMVTTMQAELAQAKRQLAACAEQIEEQQQRLTAADDLLRRARAVIEDRGWAELERDIAKFFKPQVKG